MNSFISRLVLGDGRRYWLERHALFWFICWTFMGLIYGFVNLNSSPPRYHFTIISFVEAAAYMPQHILLSYGIIYIVLPRFILRGRYWSGFLLTLVMLMMAAMTSPLIANLVIAPFRRALDLPFHQYGVVYVWLLAGLRGSFTVTGFAVSIKVVKLWYRKKVDNEKLEKGTLRAELEILKGQLNPHFMFNTLNSIYAMSLQRAEQTPSSILKLSQLLRYMLTECRETVVELQREIQVLISYIDLEKGRFADRLDLMINIEGNLSDKQIPPLLLIPFIENSFKHGANEMMEQAWISLDLSIKKSELKFKLINGKPHDAEPLALSSNIGLANVQRRLELLYPDAHNLRITQDNDTFVVGLTLQLDRVKLPE